MLLVLRNVGNVVGPRLRGVARGAWGLPRFALPSESI